MTTNGDKRQGLVPKLRFPEFRDAGEWVPTALRDVSTPITEKVGSTKLTPVSISAGQGFVSQASKFGRDISGDQYKNYTYLRKGDFAYNKGNSKKFPQGYVCQLQEFDEAAASSAFVCFQLRGGYEPRFVQSFFDQNVHGRQLSRYITSGARSDGLLNIRPEEFFNVEFPMPPKEAEQRKIAQCLSSLDMLICAETEKLAALRDHKKGLLQQLFPAEGATTPHLRFPEFRAAGNWKPLKLRSISTPVVDRVGSRQLTPVSISAGTGFVAQATKFGRDISGKQYHLYTRVRKGDFVYNKGNSIRFPQGCVYDLQDFDEVAAPNVFISFRLKSGYENGFFRYCFEGNMHGRQLAPHITSGARSNGLLNLGKDVFFDVAILTPTQAEQKRIANCMSLISEQIVAQADKLDTLKAYRIGLMQQLFPTCHEAEA